LERRNRLISPHQILLQTNINTLARQCTCKDLPWASLLSFLHLRKQHSSVKKEKRFAQQPIHYSYKTRNSGCSKLVINLGDCKQPSNSDLPRRTDKQCRFLQKDDSESSYKTVQAGKRQQTFSFDYSLRLSVKANITKSLKNKPTNQQHALHTRTIIEWRDSNETRQTLRGVIPISATGIFNDYIDSYVADERDILQILMRPNFSTNFAL